MRRFDGSAAGKVRLALLTAAAVTISACGATGGTNNDGGGNAQDSGETPAPERQAAPPADGEGTPSGDAVGANGGDQDEEGRSYERAWKVGDGGEVEVRFEDGALELLDARPNQGWKAEVEERSADEIEVEFLREDEEWRFDAGVNDGRLAVETGQKLRDADGGTYRLGDAGAVEIRQQGDGISLVQTRATGDWGADVVGRDGDEVEVRFERQDERWKLEADLDDGRLEVETSRKTTEPVRQ